MQVGQRGPDLVAAARHQLDRRVGGLKLALERLLQCSSCHVLVRAQLLDLGRQLGGGRARRCLRLSHATLQGLLQRTTGLVLGHAEAVYACLQLSPGCVECVLGIRKPVAECLDRRLQPCASLVARRGRRGQLRGGVDLQRRQCLGQHAQLVLQLLLSAGQQRRTVVLQGGEQRVHVAQLRGKLCGALVRPGGRLLTQRLRLVGLLRERGLDGLVQLRDRVREALAVGLLPPLQLPQPCVHVRKLLLLLSHCLLLVLTHAGKRVLHRRSRVGCRRPRLNAQLLHRLVRRRGKLVHPLAECLLRCG
mmetsp:Transcript_37190/g.109708  ORF Transcript_37190/g.109708 Transcript_37190/m.109708 type:complete len:305 (+) Transcript_37190:652-1566(+)